MAIGTNTPTDLRARIDALRRVCDAATAGPWEWSHRADRGVRYYSWLGRPGCEAGECVMTDGSAWGEYPDQIDPFGPDATLIAAARTWLPLLLDYMRGEVDAAAGMLLGGGEVPRPYFGFGDVTPVDEWPREVIGMTWNPASLDEDGEEVPGEWSYDTQPLEEYKLSGHRDQPRTDAAWEAAKATQRAKHDAAVAALGRVAAKLDELEGGQ